MFTFVIFLSSVISPQQVSIIDGYVSHLSAFPGDSVDLFLNGDGMSSAYRLKLTDINGKEVAVFTTPLSPQVVKNKNPYENGFGYRRTKRVALPNVPSGVYMFDGTIPIIIKALNPKIAIVYPTNTTFAYCNAGGKSLYGFNSTDKTASPVVSFMRPSGIQRHVEYFVKWMSTQSFTGVGYLSDADLEDKNALSGAELVIIAGHSEYWTVQARKNFDRFVSNGHHALILSGNTMWWQVRYNRSKQQLVCYKNAATDPHKSEKLKTVNWNEPTLNYPIYSSTGTDFTNAGYGLKTDNGWNGFKIITRSPLLEGTGLQPGDILSCPSDETDGAPLLGIENGIPILDRQKLALARAEIVGYDLVSRNGKEGIATWIVFQATPKSGIVINTASTDWCSFRGIGSNQAIGSITYNMIQKLMTAGNVFSEKVTQDPFN